MRNRLYIIAGILLLGSGVLFGIRVIKINNELIEGGERASTTEVSPPLPPPPQIEYNLSTHKKKFLEFLKDCNLSGDKRNLVAACDYLNESVRNMAVQLAGNDQGSLNLGQICDIFDYCYKNWKYVNDPRDGDIYAKASSTLTNGLNGDCDDFAIIVCSMILSIGGEARINFATGPEGGHAFTEINVGTKELSSFNEYISRRYNLSNDESEFWVREDEEGNKWMNLDWWANRPAGRYFDYNNGTSFYIMQKYCESFTK
ncbi:MAG: transglutaminase-like domain-containing protein [Bacteroidota bacterium]|jgi:transglutaminase-like putative cysteine protease